MLSQRLCKLALELTFGEESHPEAIMNDFQLSRALWKQSHYGLQMGDAALLLPSDRNSRRVQAMFATLEPTFLAVDSLCERVVRSGTQSPRQRQANTRLLLAHTETFLLQMNAIVFEYDEEFRADMQHLQVIELGLFLSIILVLALEAFLVFRPALRHIGSSVAALEKTNDMLSESNDKLLRQQEALEIQTLELESMNAQALEQNTELERQRQIMQEQMFALDTSHREVLEARRVQSEFLANISHEFRTPMTAIIGFAEILLDGFLLEEGKPFGRHILRSANILLVMLNDLIDFAHLEAGTFELKRSSQPLAPVVEEICYLMQLEATAKHLALRSFIVPEVPPLLEFDARRIRQILFNLLSNAIKFTEIGFVEIRVFFDKETKVLRFEVQDTGIGIAPQDQERIFEPFVQQDGSPTRRYGGMGIGLALVRRIIALKGGQIWVESELGKGTTIIVELPK
jgi:signal transduction histidine kinase